MGGLVGFYELAERLAEVEGLEDRVGVAVQGRDYQLPFSLHIVPGRAPYQVFPNCRARGRDLRPSAPTHSAERG